jgi:hypothetical protein
MNIAAKAIELGHGYWAFAASGVSQRSGQLGTAVEGIRAFAGLHLRELASDLKALCGRKPGKGVTLGLNAKPTHRWCAQDR